MPQRQFGWWVMVAVAGLLVTLNSLLFSAGASALPPSRLPNSTDGPSTRIDAQPHFPRADTTQGTLDLQIHKSDGRDLVQPLDQLTYTLTYTNTGPGIASTVVMSDILPPTAINVSTPALPGVITPTIELGRIIFQLGTLQVGQVGQTTVTLTLGAHTPVGSLVLNTVTISAGSAETNLADNTSTDIDRVPAPQIDTATASATPSATASATPSATASAMPSATGVPVARTLYLPLITAE